MTTLRRTPMPPLALLLVAFVALALTGKAMAAPTPSVGAVSIVMGNGLEAGYGADGGPATSASVNNVELFAVSLDANLYFEDALNDSVRKATLAAGGRAPIVNQAPLLSGTATQGQALSASTGTWSPTPTTAYIYQWQRSTDGQAMDEHLPPDETHLRACRRRRLRRCAGARHRRRCLRADHGTVKHAWPGQLRGPVITAPCRSSPARPRAPAS